MAVSYKTTHNSAIPLLGIYPKVLKTYVPTKTCTWVLIATLFIIARTWKQTRCPSVGEWINKLWYIQTTEYYSVLERNKLLSHKKPWRNLKCILLSERSQSEKGTFFLLIYFLFFYFLAALGLCCCAQVFSSCGERGLLFVVVHGLLIAVASSSLRSMSSRHTGFNSCGSWAQ